MEVKNNKNEYIKKDTEDFLKGFNIAEYTPKYSEIIATRNENIMKIFILFKFIS